MRIYLIGFMGSGKSTLGRYLSERLGLPLNDLDSTFEERYRISIADFFGKYDETIFRNIERNLLHETIHHADALIPTGGGTPCFFDNMEFIKLSGYSVYLQWPVNGLVERLQVLRKKRPLLKNLTDKEFPGWVQEQLSVREFFYKQADLVVDASRLDPEVLASLLKERMRLAAGV